MEARDAAAVEQLCCSPDFTAWYRRYSLLRQDLRNAQEHQDGARLQAAILALRAEQTQRQAEDWVFRAGDLQAQAAQAQAQVAATENASFEHLSDFEQQRDRASARWAAADSVDKAVDDERQRREVTLARLAAARRAGGPESSAEADRLEAQLQELELSLTRLARSGQQAQRAMDATAAARDAQWSQVESDWDQSFAAAMRRSELALRARRAQAAAEAAFARSAAERARIEGLQAQATQASAHLGALQAQLAALLREAEGLCGGVVLDGFAFWPQALDSERAWLVPLTADSGLLNIDVVPLRVYQVDCSRGLDFIEPLVTGDDDGVDGRLEAFFTAAPAAGRMAARQSD